MVTYVFEIEERPTLRFEIDPERVPREPREDDPGWVRLAHHKCANCPLSDRLNCPAAEDLREVVEAFEDVASTELAEVRVEAPERTYLRSCDVQTGLGSLVGLVMASSDCPILRRMHPMARTHLPFSTVEETVLRTTSLYLLGQLLEGLDGRTPDYALEGLRELYADLHTLNNAFAARLTDGVRKDANLNAVVRLFSLSALVSMSVDRNFALLAPVFSPERRQ